MNAQILRGSKEEIAQRVAQIPGEVLEVIVFVEEPADTSAPAEDVFTEMAPFVAHARGADYSREAVYARLEGE